MLVWLFVILELMIPAVISDTGLLVFDTDKICIEPGTQLSVTCNFLSSTATTSVGNSSPMLFAFHLQTDNTVTCASSPCDCGVINETAVQLLCQYLPADYDHANLSCYSQDDASISVRAPVHVRVHACILRIVEYEVVHWDTLLFRWQLDNSSLPVHSTAWYRNSMKSDSQYTRCVMSAESANTCVVQRVFDHAAPDRVMHVKVNGSFGACSCKDELVVQLNRIVNPGRVLHLRLHSAGGSTVLVQFSSPQLDYMFCYSVNVTCSPGKFSLRREIAATRENTLDVQVTGVPAYCSCNVSVAAKHSDSIVWGPAAVTSFETPPQVPSSAPEVSRSGFEIHQQYSGTRNVVIYFKPVSHKAARGTVLDYRVHIVSQGRSTKRIFPATATASLNVSRLSADVEYFLTIDARTQAGYNESIHLQTIYIPKSVDVPVVENSLSVMILSNELAHCTWKPHKDFNYTLFWCHTGDSPTQCKDDINWTECPSHASVHNISLPSASAAKNYVFGIAAENHLRHRTGIVWTSCVYTVQSIQPPTLHLLSTSQNSVTLSLMRPQCCNDHCRHIASYTVYYCMLGCHDNQCLGPVLIEHVEATGDDSVVSITGLRASERYFVVVGSCSASGATSAQNSTICVTTQGVVDMYDAVRLLGILVVVLVAVIIVCGLYSTWRCYRRNVSKRLSGQLVHEVDTAQTLIPSERQELSDVPSSQVERPQPLQHVTNSEEVAAAGKENLDICVEDTQYADDENGTSSSATQDISCLHILPKINDMAGLNVPCREEPRASLSDHHASLLPDVSSGCDVAFRRSCHSEDLDSDDNADTSTDSPSELKLLPPVYGATCANVDSVTVADIHAADSLPQEKLLPSLCGTNPNCDSL